MTAEIVIINKMGVALAADSAGTVIGPFGKKINKSQNKLFMLSKYEPIGIMEYNSADFMGIPWETIVKQYRDELGKKHFPTLKDYVDDFFEFIEKKYSGTHDDQKEYFRKLIRRKFAVIEETVNLEDETFTLKKFQEFLEKYDEEIKEDKKNTFELFPKFCIIQTCTDLGREANYYWKKIPQEFIDEILTDYVDLIDEEIGKIKCKISDDLIEYLRNIAIFSFYQRATGLVITGFGKDEIFPSIYSYTIGAIFNSELKKKLHDAETHNIDRDNPAFIIPLAQHEMVDAFLQGVTPFFEYKSMKYLNKLFDEYPSDIIEIFEGMNDKDMDKKTKTVVVKKLNEIKEKKKDIISNYLDAMNKVKNEYKIPIDAAIINLPKDELALMAESMVHITSLKRKVSIDEDETVGGAIDVAVISKGDGFVWIKRKHYFKPELNHHFFKKYYEKYDSIDGEMENTETNNMNEK